MQGRMCSAEDFCQAKVWADEREQHYCMLPPKSAEAMYLSGMPDPGDHTSHTDSASAGLQRDRHEDLSSSERHYPPAGTPADLACGSSLEVLPAGDAVSGRCSNCCKQLRLAAARDSEGRSQESACANVTE